MLCSIHCLRWLHPLCPGSSLPPALRLRACSFALMSFRMHPCCHTYSIKAQVCAASIHAHSFILACRPHLVMAGASVRLHTPILDFGGASGHLCLNQSQASWSAIPKYVHGSFVGAVPCQRCCLACGFTKQHLEPLSVSPLLVGEFLPATLHVGLVGEVAPDKKHLRNRGLTASRCITHPLVVKSWPTAVGAPLSCAQPGCTYHTRSK